MEKSCRSQSGNTGANDYDPMLGTQSSFRNCKARAMLTSRPVTRNAPLPTTLPRTDGISVFRTAARSAAGYRAGRPVAASVSSF
jgi:hypothetical protein